MDTQPSPGISQEDLRRQHQQLVNTLEHMSDAFVSLDREWRYTYVNKRAADMFGRRPEDLLGKHIWTEFPEGVGQPFYHSYHQAVKEQRLIVMEEYYPPGKRWYENRIYPTPDGLSIFFQDITEQKIAAEELRRRQHLIENILEAEPGTVYIYDLAEQRNVSMNKEWLTAFGYTREEMEDLREDLLARILHPDDVIGIVDHHARWRTASDGEVRAIEYRARTKTGEWRWLQSREIAFTRAASGDVTQILGIAHDVTVRKRSEILLAAELRVLEMVSTDIPLNEILRVIIESVEELSVSSIGSVLLLSDDGEHLKLGSAPRLPDSYNRAVEQARIGPNAGSCGTAAYTKRNVVVADIETDPLWSDYRELARAYGLRACWSTPIFNKESSVLGTFAMYYREPRNPSKDDLELIGRATHLASIAIEQKRTGGILRDSERKFRQLVEGTHAFLFATDTRGRITYLNEAAANALGYAGAELLGRFYLQFVHEEDRPRVHQIFTEQLTSAGQDRYAEFRFTGGNGKSGWLSFLVNPIVQDGRVVGLTGVAQNITERKKAEHALRSSEERFSKAFNLSPIRMGILRVKDQTILDINDMLVQELGFTREEILGKSLWEIGSIVSESDKMQIQQQLAAGQAIREMELHPVTKSGEERVVLTSAEMIEIGGEPCMLWASHDITDRKRAQDALREGEETQHALLNAPTELAMMTDLDGKILALNDAAVERLGGNSRELIGTNPMNKFPEEVSRHRRSMADRVIKTGKPERFEDKRLGRWFDNNIYPVFSTGGRVTRLAIFARDITEAKQAEEAMRQREQMLSSIYDTVGDAIFQVAVEEDHHFRFTTVNRSFLSITGLKYEQVVGKRISEVVPAASAKNVAEKYEEAIRGRTIIRWEETSEYPSGRLIGEVSVAPIFDSAGNCTHLVGAVRDITERKRAEEALKQSHEQLRALTARLQSVREEDRTRIAREIHDELGQSLTGLKMDLSWITGKVPFEQADVIARAREMRELIDATIVAVRKISSELRPGVLDNLGLAPAVEWQTEDFQKRTGIRCIFDTNCSSLEIEKELSTQLFRVLQETLTNVARHSKASEVLVSLQSEGKNIILDVEDNGRGISESELMQKKSLGLLGMRERVAMMKGEFSISGIPGKGTKIHIRVPLGTTVA
ncbi:MAG TPA: PAS domain S-box protein [Bacteroidota bacterium]|jgi:PAS domain S-box-containing protein|nr:PAS domain S-box protein [Bacteroidota bacterium]